MTNIVWQPSQEHIRQSNVGRFMDKYGIRSYEELVKRSTDDTEWFWDAALKDLGIDWFKPYERTLDASQGYAWAKWFVGGKLNIAHNCLDRYANSSRRSKVVCHWEGENSEIRRITYDQLSVEVNKLANGLKKLGVRKGDTVGIYMPMVPEISTAFLACLKIGAICVPLFSGFAASALASRLSDAEAKILLTADGFLRRGNKIRAKREADNVVASVKSIEHVVVYKRLGVEVAWVDGRDVWWHELIRNQSDVCAAEWMDSEDPAMILYTSGTSGKPKGAVHTHAGALAQCAKELCYNLDVKDEDIFFWLTDFGWMMGPWMVIGVQSLGGSYLLYEGAPDYPTPDRLWSVIEQHGITILGISPTVIRSLTRSGEELTRSHNFSKLRILASTGEPWDPESYMWFFRNVGGGRCPIINLSGGTEIAGCFLLPLPITPLKPCTLRGPGLGMDVDVFDEEGNPVRGQKGYLVAKKPAPSMTRGLWKDSARYIETYWSKWSNVWYHGDWAIIDEDGFWFLLGRADDTIKVSGRRVGPAEIESTLLEHPAVTEAAVIGVPDEVKGEEVLCFVVLKPNCPPNDQLREELKTRVAETLGKAFRPRDVKFANMLPKTASAKIVRRVVKAAFLGKDPGDLSTLQDPQAVEAIRTAT